MQTLADWDGGPGPWILFFPLIWAAVVIGVVTLLRRTVWRGRRRGGPWRPRPPTRTRPSTVLGRRFAAGEIDEDEYWRRQLRPERGVRPFQGRCGMTTATLHPDRGPSRRRREGLRQRRHRGPGPGRRERRLRGREVHRDHGSLRLRQVHADALRGGPRHPQRRLRLHRRHRPERPRRPPPDPAAPRPDRLRLPGLQPGADADGRGEHHPAHGPGGREGRRRFQGVDRRARRHRRPARPAAPPARPNSPADSSSASPWPGPSPAAPTSSSPTSPPATSTRAPARRCWACSAAPSRQMDRTVVMVTHDPVAAAHADEVVFLADGRLVDRMQAPDRRTRSSTA